VFFGGEGRSSKEVIAGSGGLRRGRNGGGAINFTAMLSAIPE
jgi:hypothetical protein